LYNILINIKCQEYCVENRANIRTIFLCVKKLAIDEFLLIN